MSKSYIIIYLDLVGYSKNNEPIQVNLFRKFQREIHHLLYDQILESACILIPTGDGMIIGIENLASDAYLIALQLAIGILNWTRRHSCKVRTAIHVGDVNILKDINRNDNIIGNTINDAARMLSGAEDDAIVISQAFYAKFLRKSGDDLGVNLPITPELSFRLIDEDEVIDKHSFEHSVYSIVLISEEKEYGIDAKIVSKYTSSIYASDYPKAQNLKDRFSKKVKKASQLIFIGIYNPSLPTILSEIEMDKRNIAITVLYASGLLDEKIRKFFNSDADKLSPKLRKESIQAVKDWHHGLQNGSQVSLNLYEYSELIPFGASAVDWGIKGKGFIHISNYLPGIIPDKTPYTEIEWRTNIEPPLYHLYHEYLLNLIAQKYQPLTSIP